MKALHVVTSIDDEAAGPSYSVPALGRALGRAGVTTDLVTVDVNTKAPSDGFTHHPFAMTGSSIRLARSKDLKAYLKSQMPQMNVSHNHSLWTMPNIYCSWASHQAGVPSVVAPRGTMHPRALQISRHVKFAFWHGLQKRACQRAAAFHATSRVEAEHIRKQGFSQPIVVLPNGVDIPPRETRVNGAPKSQYELVYFGRIHPIKGIPRLLEAWGNLKNQGKAASWKLRIVGPDRDGYAASLQADVKAQGLRDVSFDGPVFGADKFALLSQADLYVLPSDSENFGMTVVEALACSTPVIATKGTPWQDLETHGCGWWADTSVAGVQNALEQALYTPLPMLQSMGAKGRVLSEGAYSWTTIGQQMAEFYEWLLAGGQSSAPSFVDVR